LNEQSLIPAESTEVDLLATELSTNPAPQADGPDSAPSTTELDDDQLLVLLEGLLFVASEPAAIERLATALDVSIARVEQGLQQLEAQLERRGIRLQRHNGSAQLVSAPEVADAIEVFLGLDLNTKLSRAALEALAIIAYRQPVTRPQIEAIRGVNSDGVIRTLLHRGLIEEVGRLEQAGRPILYGTTFAFLQYFGLENVDGLPPLDEEALGELAARVMRQDETQPKSTESGEIEFPQPTGEDPDRVD
jgi:segregation and condensation protein B